MVTSLRYLCFTQNVKAYFRRGTAREMLGYYKDAIDGKIFHPSHIYVQLSISFRKLEGILELRTNL